MFCVSCGNELRAEARFCTKCGHAVPGRTPLERMGSGAVRELSGSWVAFRKVAPLAALILLALVQLAPAPFGFFPGVALLIIAIVRGWRWSSAVLLGARVAELLLFGFMLYLEQDAGSSVAFDAAGNKYYTGSRSHRSGDDVVPILVSVVFIGTVLLFFERAGRVKRPKRWWAAAATLFLVLCLLAWPAFDQWKELLRRHELTKEERGKATSLMEEFAMQDWTFHPDARNGWNLRQVVIHPVTFTADPYGQLSFRHTIAVDGRQGDGSFTLMCPDIQPPGEVWYQFKKFKVLVRYSADSLRLERHDRNGAVYYCDALSQELIERREHERTATHQARYQERLDSLHAITETYTARFMRSDCNVACTAVFEVEDNGARINITTYLPELVVDGTDIRAISADGTDWSLTVRKSIPDPGVSGDIASVQERLEVIGLKRIEKPVVVDVPPVAARKEPVQASAAPKPKEPVSPRMDRIAADPDQLPVFDQGRTPLPRWFRENLRYPEVDKANNEVGTVVLSFNVEKDGRMSDIKVERGRTSTMNEEALRLARSMPLWSPALKADNPVRYRHTVSVAFKL